MNLERSEEQLALGDAVRRMLGDKATVAAHARALIGDPTGMTEEVWQSLVQLGTTGLLVPEEHGGVGMTMVEAGVVLEELGRVLYPGPWLSTAVAAPRALARAGPGADGSAAKLLRGIAEGSVLATVCLAQSPLSVTAGAGAVDEDLVSGEAGDVADVAAAGVVLVPVRQGERWALYEVGTSSPGVTVHQLESVDLTRRSFRVVLQDAPARRIGEMSDDALQALVDDVLVANAADALGAAGRALELAVDYAKVRAQFGKPIGAFQAVQHMCVDMYETVELARGGVLLGLWAADHAGAEDRHLAALQLKAFAGRLATVGDTAIQVLGGMGYTWEHDAQLFLRRLLGWSSYLGSPDRYLEEVGRLLVRSRLTEGVHP